MSVKQLCAKEYDILLTRISCLESTIQFEAEHCFRQAFISITKGNSVEARQLLNKGNYLVEGLLQSQSIHIQEDEEVTLSHKHQD